MSTKDLSKIVEQIKKSAQGVPKRPGGSVAPAAKDPSPSAPARPGEINLDPVVVTSPKRPAGGGGAVGNASVKELQNAIINFANVASSTDLTGMQKMDSGQQFGNQSAGGPGDATHKDDKNFLGGSNPFGSFLVDNYMNKTKEKTYVDTDVAGGKKRQEAAIVGGGIQGVINTIRHIGSPGMGEKKPDGVWKDRTQQALLNILAVTKAVFELSQDMKIQVSGYSQKYLDNFDSNLPRSYTEIKPQDLVSLAKWATGQVNAATAFFKEISSKILNNPALKGYIDQSKSFAQYKQAPKQDLQAIPEDVRLQPIQLNMKNLKRNLYLGDLENLRSLQRWMSDNGLPTPDENAVKQMLAVIKEQLG